MKKIIDIPLALCVGVVFSFLSFARSLFAYGIVSEFWLCSIALIFYLILGICIWGSGRDRLQPLLRMLFVIPGYIAGFAITVYFEMLPRICAAYHMDASSNLQGLLEMLSICGMFLVGIGIAAFRICTMKAKK